MSSTDHLLIKSAIQRLHTKFNNLNVENLAISEYTRVYLKKYIDNYSFYMTLYADLLSKSVKKIHKPITQSVFVDYGGGCGILTYLAKELGFKQVIYNDIYIKSVNDTKVISRALGIVIDDFICGDVDVFVDKINSKKIHPDLICSFDVLEHIYNLDLWFNKISKIENDFSLYFLTSANPRNQFIVNRLKKIQLKAEYKGLNKAKGWKKSDLNTSFLEARKNIIKDLFTQLEKSEIDDLSRKTRGLRKEDIEKQVSNYILTGVLDYQINHPTNTCDPYTGNWTENLLDLNKLKMVISKHNLKVEITNSFYSYSNNKILNIPKYLLNLMIRLLGSKNLLFSPTYTLEVKKGN